MNASLACPLSQGCCADLTADDASSAIGTTLPLAHWLPPEPWVLAPRGFEPLLTPSRSSRTAPPAPPLLFKNSCPRAAGPSQPRPSRALSDPPPFAHSYTAGDGSSRPPHMFKITSVQHLRVFPSNTPFPRLRIKPLLEVFSAAGNGSSRPFNLFKQTSVQDPWLPPQSRPFLAFGSTPVRA
jgi:hypothetical protein